MPKLDTVCPLKILIKKKNWKILNVAYEHSHKISLNNIQRWPQKYSFMHEFDLLACVTKIYTIFFVTIFSFIQHDRHNKFEYDRCCLHVNYLFLYTYV